MFILSLQISVGDRGGSRRGSLCLPLYEPIMESGEEANSLGTMRPRSASFTVGQRPTRVRSFTRKQSPLVSSPGTTSDTVSECSTKHSELDTPDGDDSGISLSPNDSMETASMVSSSTILEDNVLTNYAPNYTKPRTLTGSSLTYHFPSPMHAIIE